MASSSTGLKTLLAAILLVIAFPSLAEYSAGTAGGEHGAYRSSGCNSDEWPVGLKIAGGTYVHNVAIMCAMKSNLRDIRTENVVTTYSMVDFLAGNRREETKFCPRGYVLAGIKVQSGSYVDRVNSMRCQRISDSRLTYQAVGIGGRGGSTTRMYCRRGDTVSGIRVRSGQWVDQMTVYCD